MQAIRASLAAVAVSLTLTASGIAEANGRMSPSIYTHEWGGTATGRTLGGDLVAEAARYVGSGKFTRLPGAWCADAVNVWLRAIGKPPLANRMAASALSYGPHVGPRVGALAVLGHRGRAYHVGIVEGVNPDGSIRLISGNWSRRVGRGIVPRSAVLAFIGT